MGMGHFVGWLSLRASLKKTAGALHLSTTFTEAVSAAGISAEQAVKKAILFQTLYLPQELQPSSTAYEKQATKPNNLYSHLNWSPE